MYKFGCDVGKIPHPLTPSPNAEGESSTYLFQFPGSTPSPNGEGWGEVISK